jgi:antitoxin component HigA of HigAB toxin-antitoxin module
MTLAAKNIFTARYEQLMRAFPLRQIKTKADAAAATKILDKLFADSFADPGEEQYVIVLANLLGDYEDEHDPFESTATGLDILKHLMEENEINSAALARALGVGPSAVSMILSGVRSITASHANKLGKIFHISAAAFL